jgi:hypothetical protein
MIVCPDDAEFYSECWQAIKHCPLGIEARLFSQCAKTWDSFEGLKRVWQVDPASEAQWN